MRNREPLSKHEREYLYLRKQAGASHAEVAKELGCSSETIRKRWQSYRRKQADKKRGRPLLGILSTFPAEISQKAIEFKTNHPHWGPANVLLELRNHFGDTQMRLPSPSRLSALFKVRCPQAIQQRRKHPKPAAPPSLVRHVHQRWQIDAKEDIRLENGEIASILNIRDPTGAIMIASQAFLTTLTQTTYRKITFPEIQNTLRLAFAEWGRPAEIQTDHETVFAGPIQSDFPMPFTLWLIGLGIRHQLSRSRCPTDQAHVERNHRTMKEMCWVDQPPKDLVDFQWQLDQTRYRYNWKFPSHAANCQGQPPLVHNPQAVSSGRPYQILSELDLFDLPLVDNYLSQFCWIRKLDVNGVAWLGNQVYYLGKTHKSQFLSIRFEPENRSFAFSDTNGNLIKNLLAKGLSKEDLTGLIPSPIQLGLPLQLTLPWVGV